MTVSFLTIGTLFSVGILLRAAISLHSYSGESKPPMFGDFEAQRHWQEITVNLPIRDWYENTTDNDLLYWGLDYPPLTAYHSLLVGKWAQFKDPAFVELHESRGITDDRHKEFMRNTVLLLDILLYMPAILVGSYTVRKKILGGNLMGSDVLSMVFAILYPGQILIDNGHFQYNNASLGLAAFAIAAILAERHLLGALMFALALNYKQMELYHALPFFFYLLQWCFRSSKGFDFGGGIWKLMKVGSVVVVAFVAIWSPWIWSVDSLKQVVHRVFPVARGVFEDKVSNVWCVVNVFIKLRNYPNSFMAIVCLVCTLLAVLPSGVHLLFRPSKRNFLLALLNSSLGFFLFSFQVHEKSILLATLPALLLFQLYPMECFWLLQIATFSMIPLLHKDGLLLPYLALTLLTLTLLKLSMSALNNFKPVPKISAIDLFNLGTFLQSDGSAKSHRINRALVMSFYGSLLGQMLLLFAFVFVQPPAQLPFLWPLLISVCSCGHFVLFFIYFNYRQFFSNGNEKTTNETRAIGKRKVK
uniref:Alpha-1,3-glucosyltransferase n=1 Tax=Aedes albopictus TaxID=7160 RepID=A0A023EWB5_AEDAL